MSDGELPWVHVAAFTSIALACRRIRELEVLPLAGDVLEVHIGENASDDDVLSLLLCSGLKTQYALRREPALMAHGENGDGLRHPFGAAVARLPSPRASDKAEKGGVSIPLVSLSERAYG